PRRLPGSPAQRALDPPRPLPHRHDPRLRRRAGLHHERLRLGRPLADPQGLHALQPQQPLTDQGRPRPVRRSTRRSACSAGQARWRRSIYSLDSIFFTAVRVIATSSFWSGSSRLARSSVTATPPTETAIILPCTVARGLASSTSKRTPA